MSTTLGPLEESLVRARDAEDEERVARYAAAWRWYTGDHPASLKVREGEADDNVRLNFARLVVRAGVRALFGVAPTWTTNDDRLDAVLDAWRRANPAQRRPGWDLQTQALAINGAVTGHAWAKWSISPDDPYPRLKVLDPAICTAYWAEDDHEDVYAYRLEWATFNRSGRPVERRQIIERDTFASWTIRDEERTTQSAKWVARSAPVVWPYSWPPILETQNLVCPNEFYGTSDLEEDTLDLNRALNLNASSMQKIVRLYAHPRDVGFGFGAREVQMAPGQMPTIPNPDARIDTLGLLGDLAASLDVYNRLKEAMHSTTATPEVAVGKLDTTGPMSGAALRILYGPLVDSTEQKRLTYGPLVELAQAQALVLLGAVGDTAEVDVETTWPEIIPSDPLQERQALTMDEQLGASKQTILAKLGYNAEEELAVSAEEARASAEAQARLFASGQSGDPFASQP